MTSALADDGLRVFRAIGPEYIYASDSLMRAALGSNVSVRQGSRAWGLDSRGERPRLCGAQVSERTACDRPIRHVRAVVVWGAQVGSEQAVAGSRTTCRTNAAVLTRAKGAHRGAREITRPRPNHCHAAGAFASRDIYLCHRAYQMMSDARSVETNAAKASFHPSAEHHCR